MGTARLRAGGLILLCCLFCAALFVRLFQVQVVAHEEYREKRDNQAHSIIQEEGFRGTLFSRDGDILALSVPVSSAFADPRKAPVERADDLAAVLSLESGFVSRRLSRESRFVWLKRKVSEEEEKALRDLDLPGIGFRREFLRVYPHRTLLSQALGHVNIDEQGGMGVERFLDDELRPRVVSHVVRADALRNALDPVKRYQAGCDVHLTVDVRLQRVVENALEAGIQEWNPKWASVVVLDPRSGRILAIANRPAFDPNRPGECDPEARRNRAITDPYEPGSVVKTLIVSAALEEGLINLKSRFNCPGAKYFGKRRLKCHKSHGTIELTDVIARSCSVAAADIGVHKLGDKRVESWYRRFGLGSRTGVEMPSESGGKFRPLEQWTPYYSVSSVSVGHEISVTALQLAAAISTIANGGTRFPAHIVERVTDASGTVVVDNGSVVGEKVLSPDTAARVRGMMAETVRRGTARRLKLDGVEFAAKTGTSQKFDPEIPGYSTQKHICSIATFAPVENARMTVIVVMDEPQGGHSGGLVAGPTAARIISEGLPLLMD